MKRCKSLRHRKIANSHTLPFVVHYNYIYKKYMQHIDHVLNLIITIIIIIIINSNININIIDLDFFLNKINVFEVVCFVYDIKSINKNYKAQRLVL